MKFYENRIVGIKTIESDYEGLYNILCKNYCQGVDIQSITKTQAKVIEKMIQRNGNLKERDWDFFSNLKGSIIDDNPHLPFVLFCPRHLGSVYMVGNNIRSTGKKEQIQFALIPKNVEKGILTSQIECVKGYRHHSEFYDHTKYSDTTIYTTETISSFMAQALPYFEKFYIAEKPLYDDSPEKADKDIAELNEICKTKFLPRRQEITLQDMKKLIDEESNMPVKDLTV